MLVCDVNVNRVHWRKKNGEAKQINKNDQKEKKRRKCMNEYFGGLVGIGCWLFALSKQAFECSADDSSRKMYPLINENLIVGI